MSDPTESSTTAADYRLHLPQRRPEYTVEDDRFRASPVASASAPLARALLLKARSFHALDDILRRYDLTFSGSLLELGGGYGHLSVYLKYTHPSLHVVYSDVSEEAVRKSAQFERFFDVHLDAKWATAAEDTPFEDAAFDTVMFFGSFHHTADPGAAAREAARILAPGGRLVLMLEPARPWWLGGLYHRHVQRQDDNPNEKHYTLGEYRRFLRGAGLSFRHHPYKNFMHRYSRSATAYYTLLSLVPNVLTWLVPCSRVIVGTKGA